MAMQINTNISALDAQRTIQKSQAALSKTMQRLSSGMRINKAADDAAGLGISDKFQSQIRQYQQDSNSLQSGYNMMQTADGGLSQQNNVLARVRELAVQATNGTLTDGQRNSINAEAQQMLEEINTTAQNTEFNGQKVLEGVTTTLTSNGQSAKIDASNAATLGIVGVDLSTQAGAQSAIDTINSASTKLNANRTQLGAQMNKYESSINQLGTSILNATASDSQIRDADIAQETANMARNQILSQASISSMAMSNFSSQAALSLLR